MGYEVFIVENTTQRVRKVIHFTMLEFTPCVRLVFGFWLMDNVGLGFKQKQQQQQQQQ